MGKSYRRDAGNDKWRKKWHQKQNKKNKGQKNLNPLRPESDLESDGFDGSLSGTVSWQDLQGV